MKTNAKSRQKWPVFAYLHSTGLSLDISSKTQTKFIQKTIAGNQPFESLVVECMAEANQLNANLRCAAIILSAELTLYWEQVFPVGLSDAELNELLHLQLQNRNHANTSDVCFDYFAIQHTQQESTYGLFEAKQDILQQVLDVFADNGWQTVLVVPQIIVLINQLIRTHVLTGQTHLLCVLLEKRVYIAHVVKQRVNAIDERVFSESELNIDLIDTYLRDNQLVDPGDENTVVLVMNWHSTTPPQSAEVCFKLHPDNSAVACQPRTTISWLKQHYDLYKSATLA